MRLLPLHCTTSAAAADIAATTARPPVRHTLLIQLKIMGRVDVCVLQAVLCHHRLHCRLTEQFIITGKALIAQDDIMMRDACCQEVEELPGELCDGE